MNKNHVNKDKYHLSTISSFCITWCEAYSNTADIKPQITMLDNDFYPMVHSGTAKIFSYKWARDVIKATYACVIVDEYQDCVLNQHQIFQELNKAVPVYVLGDPLQAIFGFKENLVSWKTIGFEVLENEIETHPWRWDKTNPALGEYLTTVRSELLPGLNGQEVTLSTAPVKNAVYRIKPDKIHSSDFYNMVRQYESVLYIAKWPNDTTAFSQRSGGFFQNDETQNLTTLYEYAKKIDSADGYIAANAVFDFLADCTSGISTELKSYGEHVRKGNCDFSRIKKFPEFGVRIAKIYKTHSNDDILTLLAWIKENTCFRIYRKELFSEMQRALRRSRDRKTTVLQAAQEIRMIPGNQSKYANFKYLSSRTLLSKGLEFDCVIIDLTKVNRGKSNRYTSTDMYVAMTRAKRAIYFITDQDSVVLSVPQGISV